MCILQRESEPEKKIESLRVRNGDRCKSRERYREREIERGGGGDRMTPKALKTLSENETKIQNEID